MIRKTNKPDYRVVAFTTSGLVITVKSLEDVYRIDKEGIDDIDLVFDRDEDNPENTDYQYIVELSQKPTGNTKFNELKFKRTGDLEGDLITFMERYRSEYYKDCLIRLNLKFEKSLYDTDKERTKKITELTNKLKGGRETTWRGIQGIDLFGKGGIADYPSIHAVTDNLKKGF
ncbi:MAG: hypothetical protein LBT00_00930 [Spirochaetaceae bacterium]|jgi:hypothetical protein|nr:hypothetical protein [Spirochaetaceae bacterium]